MIRAVTPFRKPSPQNPLNAGGALMMRASTNCSASWIHQGTLHGFLPPSKIVVSAVTPAVGLKEVEIAERKNQFKRAHIHKTGK